MGSHQEIDKQVYFEFRVCLWLIPSDIPSDIPSHVNPFTEFIIQWLVPPPPSPSPNTCSVVVCLVFAPLIGEDDEEMEVSKATYAAVGCLAQQVGVIGLKGERWAESGLGGCSEKHAV